MGWGEQLYFLFFFLMLGSLWFTTVFFPRPWISLLSPHIHNISFWIKSLASSHRCSHINFTPLNLALCCVSGDHSSIFSGNWLAPFSTNNHISLWYFQPEQIPLGGFHLYTYIILNIGNIPADGKQGVYELLWQTLNKLGLWGLLLSWLLHQ